MRTAIKRYRVNADRWDVLADLLAGEPEAFNTASDSLHGDKVTVGTRSLLGQLPDEWRAAWHNDNTDYAIWSYKTPIAWRAVDTWYGNDGVEHTYRWVVPNAHYSVTTSKHQGKVRTALSQISGGI